MNEKAKETDEIQTFDQKCKKMLNEEDIRFVGIINNMGRQIAGGYKKGITPLVDEEEHKMGIQHTLGYALVKDFDKSLGPVEYIATKRKKVVMITIPVQNHIILISAEHNADAEEIVKKVTGLKFLE